MNGKLVGTTSVNDDYVLLTIKEVESSQLMGVTIKKGEYDLEELKTSPWIAVHTTIVPICNANKGHIYPDGTLGCESRGF